MQESPLKALEVLWETTKKYLDTKVQLVKLLAIEKASHIIALIISQLILLITTIFFVLFLSIGMALWIGSLLGKLYDGFFIVAAFYMVLGLFHFLFKRKWVKNPIHNFLIKELLK